MTDDNIWLKLGNNYIEANMENARDTAESEESGTRNTYLRFDEASEETTLEIDSDGSFHVQAFHEGLGIVSIDFKPSAKMDVELIEYLVKRMNRIRTAIEATQ